MTLPIRNLPLLARLLLLFCIAVMCTGFFTYVAYLSMHGLFGVEKPEDVIASKLNSQADINAFLYVQAFYSIGAFLISALLFARLESTRPLAHLHLNVRPQLKTVLLAAFTICIAQFFISFLVEINSKIQLPAQLAFLNEQQEDIARLTNQILSFTGFSQFLYVAFVIAVIPAVGEELIFRGVILGDMLREKIHPAVAIALSGLCFAIAHFEFNNTLAIWVLGSFLGYLYYVTGSIWVSIAAHFINNLLTVLFKYLFNSGILSSDIADADAPLYATIISAVLFAGCIYIFHKWRRPFFTAGEHEFSTPQQPENLA